MELGSVQWTALVAAAMRAVHLLDDADPKIFVDDLALKLLGDDSEALLALVRSTPISPAAHVLRSRYAEGRLAAAIRRGARQYVLLGAGLDSYAHRVGSGGDVVVYEVDLPDLLMWKRSRLADLGLDMSASNYVPCDFEATEVGTALASHAFDSSAPCFVSWLGVTEYIAKDAVMATLRWVARQAQGSEIVLTYCPPDAADRPTIGTTQEREPTLGTMFDRDEIEAMLTRAGLRVDDHPAVTDMNERYFAGRTDGLRAPTIETCVAALVP